MSGDVAEFGDEGFPEPAELFELMHEAPMSFRRCGGSPPPVPQPAALAGIRPGGPKAAAAETQIRPRGPAAVPWPARRRGVPRCRG